MPAQVVGLRRVGESPTDSFVDDGCIPPPGVAPLPPEATRSFGAHEAPRSDAVPGFFLDPPALPEA